MSKAFLKSSVTQPITSRLFMSEYHLLIILARHVKHELYSIILEIMDKTDMGL